MTFSKKNIEHIKKNRFHLSKIKNLIIVFLLLFVVGINAQIRPVDVDKIVEAEMIRQNLPGLAIGVYKKGEINYLKGYGFIDVNSKKPITTNTVFRWASISKTLTAVAALQLDEKKGDDFSIKDKVTKHYSHWTSKNKFGGKYLDIPDKTRKNKITIKHLLTHRSGINHYSRGVDDKKGQYKNKDKSNYESYNQKFNANSSVDIFRQTKLDFNPGSKFLYTTYGYNLLGAVVDKVSGSYPKWVEKNIKNKLGMSSLKIATSNDVPIGFQKPKDGIITQGKNYNKEYVLPGGGWESNIKDLMKFARGINDGRLLEKKEKLWEDEDGVKQYNGLESKGTDASLRVWHLGSQGNIRTNMYIRPKSNIIVVIMYPSEYAERWNIVKRIVDKMGIDKTFTTSPIDKCVKGKMGSSNTRFAALWIKSKNDVVIRRGYSTDNFKKEWSFLTSKGYHLEDIEVYYHKKKLVWDGIFKMGRGQYSMWRNYDYNGFKKKWDEMNNKGYRLYDLETYMVSGKRKWAGLFKKGSGKYAMWRNQSTSDFALKRKVMAKKGMKLIDIEVFESKRQLKWSGVWIAGTDGKLNRNYNRNDFVVLRKKRANAGYKLIDVEVYKANGKEKWAGIWIKDSRGSGFKYNKNYCDLMKVHDDYSNKGFELIDLESY